MMDVLKRSSIAYTLCLPFFPETLVKKTSFPLFNRLSEEGVRVPDWQRDASELGFLEDMENSK